MKLLLLLAIVLIAYSSATPMVVQKTDLVTKLEEMAERRCSANSDNPNAFEELEYAMGSLPECIMKDVEERPPPLADDLVGLCKFLEKMNTVSCLAALGEKVKPCLDTEEQFLPDFVLDTYKRSMTEICNGGKRDKFIKILSTASHAECLKRNDIKSIVVDRCIRKTYIFQHFYEENFVLKKEDLCGDITTIQTCVTELLREECKEDLSEVVNMSMEPYEDWCSENNVV